MPHALALASAPDSDREHPGPGGGARPPAPPPPATPPGRAVARAAQPTPTERAAAGPVLATIDSLQTALRPSRMADRLALARDLERGKRLARGSAPWGAED